MSAFPTAGFQGCILGSFEVNRGWYSLKETAQQSVFWGHFSEQRLTSARQMRLIKAPPVGIWNAKVIHLNEFKIHIVLGQIIQCQAQTVCIYICWQSRSLLGHHSLSRYPVPARFPSLSPNPWISLTLVPEGQTRGKVKVSQSHKGAEPWRTWISNET
jgi:hypothetical protein